MYVCLSVSQSVCLYASLSDCLPADCLSVSLAVWPSICLSCGCMMLVSVSQLESDRIRRGLGAHCSRTNNLSMEKRGGRHLDSMSEKVTESAKQCASLTAIDAIARLHLQTIILPFAAVVLHPKTPKID